MTVWTILFCSPRVDHFGQRHPVHAGRSQSLPSNEAQGKVVVVNDVTRILSAIEQGDPQAAQGLLPLVYDELRELRRQRLAHEKPGQTLQATALIHEANLRLVDSEQARGMGPPRPPRRGRRGHAADRRQWRPRPAAAQAWGRRTTGGPRPRRGWPDDTPDEDLLALDEALRRSSGSHPISVQPREAPVLRRAWARVRRGGSPRAPRRGRPALGLRPGLALRSAPTGGVIRALGGRRFERSCLALGRWCATMGSLERLG